MASHLINLEFAQERVLDSVEPGPIIPVPLPLARGRWLAQPLIARRGQPPHDASAMDGYVVTAGPGPWRVGAHLPAETIDPAPLGPGEAARIFTGAPLPTNAVGVLLQEDATRDADTVASAVAVVPGRWIRHRGSDFTDGATLLPVGVRISPGVIALAAMAGYAALPCHRPRDITLLATGSELVEPGAPGPGTPATNNVMLGALFADYQVTDLGIAADSFEMLRAALRTFAADNPNPALLVLSGGASVGDHDLVRPALEAEGWMIDLHRVAVKPGKPLIVAHRDGHVALGLPGNPVSAFVTAVLFALPLLRKSAGCRAPLPQMQTATLAGPISAGGDRTEFLRAVRQPDGRVLPFTAQDSAGLHVLARADLLIRSDIGAPALDVGDPVPVIAIG